MLLSPSIAKVIPTHHGVHSIQVTGVQPATVWLRKVPLLSRLFG